MADEEERPVLADSVSPVAGTAEAADEATLAMMRTAARYQLIQRLVTVLGTIAGIVAIWIPLQAFQPIVASLAGRSTDVSLVVNISFVASISFAAALTVTGVKMRSQSKELTRQRERAGRLEQELMALRSQEERQ